MGIFGNSASNKAGKKFKEALLPVLQAVAQGDFTPRVKTDGESGDFLAVAEAANDALDHLTKESNATLRIKAALDSVNIPVQVADLDYNIFYVNKAAQNMFQSHQDDFRRLLPNFDVSKVVGVNIDSFHKNPAHQRQLLDNLRETYTSADLAFCDTFIVRVSATPIVDDAGQRVGTVLEWLDRSAEVGVEREVSQMIASVQQGDLSIRMDTEGKTGFFATLTDGLNEVTTTVDAAVGETVTALKALEQGDLSFEITNEYEGSFDEIKQAVNATIGKLNRTMDEDIGPVLDAAKAGDLTQRVQCEKYVGFYKQLGDATNDLIDKSEQAIDDTVAGLKALEAGDLSFEITNEYEGSFDVIKQAANATISKLNRTLNEDIGPVLDAAKAGDLSNRVQCGNYVGFYKQLGDATNDLIDKSEQAIDDTVTALKALERGDLTHRITNDYEGSFDEIKQASNNTSEKLAEIIQGISDAALEVGNGTKEIVSGNAQLNEATQEQAASLEETAASIEEITGTIQQTADNSRQANQLSTEAGELAEKGSSVAADATGAMSGISKSSNKIADIIGVIDEIAFQTNLLALNAAVEAARAGEQGRGFAVVAGEVRTLAQRSAEAAKEIKGLINDSVASVTEGGRLVDQSGEALKEIVGSVGKVTDIVAEIAAASVEQASGVDQINKAVATLDSGTQQNAAMVEEVNAVSENLGAQVEVLNELVSIFELGR